MGFDGAATFTGDKTGVQRKLKEHSLMHCLSTVLQLASVQAANATPGIKHVYTTLKMLWILSFLPQTCSVIKKDSESSIPSRAKDCEMNNTHWLAHEHCGKVGKASYSMTVLAL